MVGTFQTFFLLSVPVFLIGIPIAIWAKSQRVKWVAASSFMGVVMAMLIFLVLKYLV